MNKTTSSIFTPILLCIFLLSAPSHAQIYMTEDEHGNKHFTDNPPANENAKPVELKHTNIQPETQVVVKLQPKAPKALPNYKVWIASPEDQSRLGPTEKTLTIVAGLNRTLAPGNHLVFLVNGQAIGKPTRSQSATVPHLRRGSHTISVMVTDSSGTKVITKSPAKTIYVLRANLKLQ